MRATLSAVLVLLLGCRPDSQKVRATVHQVCATRSAEVDARVAAVERIRAAAEGDAWVRRRPEARDAQLSLGPGRQAGTTEPAFNTVTSQATAFFSSVKKAKVGSPLCSDRRRIWLSLNACDTTLAAPMFPDFFARAISR